MFLRTVIYEKKEQRITCLKMTRCETATKCFLVQIQGQGTDQDHILVKTWNYNLIVRIQIIKKHVFVRTYSKIKDEKISLRALIRFPVHSYTAIYLYSLILDFVK